MHDIPYIANCSRWKSFAVLVDYLVTAKLFQLNIFVPVFKLECHGRTLQEENRTVNAIYSWLFQTPLPLIRLISRVHVVGTPRSGFAVTVAQATLCDFQLDTILQPHCL